MTPAIGSPWWKTRVDFNVDDIERNHEAATSDQSGSVEGGSSDVDSEMGVDNDVMERKSARFTQYSLSSSVVPRSEGEVRNYSELTLILLTDSQINVKLCGVIGS